MLNKLQLMELFTRNIEEVINELGNPRKDSVIYHLKKNFQLHIQYVIIHPTTKTTINFNGTKKNGGQNKICYMLTEQTYELLLNSYNFKNKYITSVNNNIKVVNSINMCIESQTIGFIENTLKELVDLKRQYTIGIYRVDLYFPTYKLIVECDENGHSDRNQEDELIREQYLLSLGNTLIRFNPNIENFDLSSTLNRIISRLFKPI